MTRVVLLLFGTMFHTAMIACAAYVYMEAVHPFIERRLGPVPFASAPVFRAAGEFWDDMIDAVGLPD